MLRKHFDWCSFAADGGTDRRLRRLLQAVRDYSEGRSFFRRQELQMRPRRQELDLREIGKACQERKFSNGSGRASVASTEAT